LHRVYYIIYIEWCGISIPRWIWPLVQIHCPTWQTSSWTCRLCLVIVQYVAMPASPPDPSDPVDTEVNICWGHLCAHWLDKLYQSVVEIWMMHDDKQPRHRTGSNPQPSDLQSNVWTMTKWTVNIFRLSVGNTDKYIIFKGSGVSPGSSPPKEYNFIKNYPFLRSPRQNSISSWFCLVNLVAFCVWE
jgi:hypothetical protein